MLKYVALIALSAMIFVGCGSAYFKAPLAGGIVTNVTYDGSVSAEQGGEKQGKSKCHSILGIVGYGDCSIEAAKKNGGISMVSSVDYDFFTVLGIYAGYTVIVTGR